MSDIEIARAASKKPIQEIAAKIGISNEHILPYGHDKAKVSEAFIKSLANEKDGHLILVTAINPTPAGEGKTTTTVGLGDGLNAIGKKAAVCIREASLGPCFGMKGGAAGGGYAQVVPMEEMNLRFTGDFHAITPAHNLLAAMLDNHVYWGNELEIDIRRVAYRRVIDMNDRALRHVVCNLGGVANGFPREAGFDITVASEAILCQHWAKGSEGTKDLANRVVEIVEEGGAQFAPLYPDEMSLFEKIETVAKRVYRADEVVADKKIRDQLTSWEDQGYGHLPVCMAKTQYSFTTDPTRRGAPTGHSLPVREVRLSAGAGFIVVVCGEIMTMPGLPRVPSAEAICLNEEGFIDGLF